jgi:ABC-2 type transport system ATP-binding protein
MRDIMIETKDLRKEFGRTVAVSGLSLQVPEGELFCFLGPNGAGKTTTIKMLTGLLKPTRGVGLVGGLDMQKDPVEAKKLMGYIPDMPFVYERLTAEEFYRFAGDLYNVPSAVVNERLTESFTLFGLIDHRNVLVKDFSHGMRQRLIYCATFLHDPDVMFVDEPLMGLDPYTIRMIKDLLKQRTTAGACIFLTTHILALAEDIADRVGIINHGQLIALGSIDELRQLADTTGPLEDVFLKLTGQEYEV